MARRRVAIVTDWYPSADLPVRGVFVAEQARAVARRHEVAVVVSPAAGSKRGRPWRVEEGEELGLRTLRVGARSSRVPKLEFALRLAGTLAALRRVRPDVIHAHVFGPGLVGVLAGRLLRVPVVVSEHYSGIARGTVPEAELRLARFVYRRADVVCPVSRQLASRIEALAPSARVRVVPNVVDVERFADGAAERRPHHALFVGALDDAKGLPELLEAAASVRARRIPLTLEVVGDGPGRRGYERRALALGLGDAVAFRGVLPRDEVAAAMRRAAFLVHPSHWENLPCVVLEALASGLPVVATAVGGVPEVVGPDEGVLVPPGDADALADALADVAARLGAFDRARLSREAARRFGSEAIAEAWSDVYESVVRGP